MTRDEQNRKIAEWLGCLERRPQNRNRISGFGSNRKGIEMNIDPQGYVRKDGKQVREHRIIAAMNLRNGSAS